MGKMTLKKFALTIFFAAAVFAQGRNTAQAAFVQASNAYSAGDWESAQVLLRTAMSYPENNTEEVGFMLVAAEMYGENYSRALADSGRLLNEFPKGQYASYFKYQRGRALFHVGEHNEAIIELSNFCHENPEHQLYASALYWIAEAFYAGYSYDEAERLYTRIVSEFPESEKFLPSKYRIDAIAQRYREEKLLYLLQQTGEEYLAAREEYERQLRAQNASDAARADFSDEVSQLKMKARQIQNLLDARFVGGAQ